MGDEDVDVVKAHRVDAFDVGTEIMVMTDGSLRLKLPSMPPSWSSDERLFESFEESLSAALGVSVEGLDKEFFGIPAPAADTVERLSAHLIELRRRAQP